MVQILEKHVKLRKVSKYKIVDTCKIQILFLRTYQTNELFHATVSSSFDSILIESNKYENEYVT